MSDHDQDAFERLCVEHGFDCKSEEPGKKAEARAARIGWNAGGSRAGVPTAGSSHSVLLGPDHEGLRVDYSGLLKQAQVALSRGEKEPAVGEMLRQFQAHIKELGTRWYAGDTAVVDELLQLYCVEKDARTALASAPQAIEVESGRLTEEQWREIYNAARNASEISAFMRVVPDICAAEPLPEPEAMRDMLEDARSELQCVREALGVSYEPHQSLFDRTLDAARAIPHSPLNGLRRALRVCESKKNEFRAREEHGDYLGALACCEAIEQVIAAVLAPIAGGAAPTGQLTHGALALEVLRAMPGDAPTPRGSLATGQIAELTADDVERQYDESGIHIGSGLPRDTCPCGFCEKFRFGFAAGYTTDVRDADRLIDEIVSAVGTQSRSGRSHLEPRVARSASIRPAFFVHRQSLRELREEGDQASTTIFAQKRSDKYVAAYLEAASCLPSRALEAAFPRYTQWRYLRDHGQWSDGVPDWARDHSGRMCDMTAAQRVIEELSQAQFASSTRDAIIGQLDFVPDAPHAVADMANIGYALMERIALELSGNKGCDSPPNGATKE